MPAAPAPLRRPPSLRPAVRTTACPHSGEGGRATATGAVGARSRGESVFGKQHTYARLRYE